MTGSPSAGTVAAAVLLPPLGVFWRRGAGRDFAIACGLTLVGFLPGVAFALLRVLGSQPRQ
ncbi:MAG: YqaE/Pmp3 family membrane protein [Sphingomonas sp.]|nr:YqaE/Pmp3 family membrane protein [Sphingomonas sp.]